MHPMIRRNWLSFKFDPELLEGRHIRTTGNSSRVEVLLLAIVNPARKTMAGSHKARTELERII